MSSVLLPPNSLPLERAIAASGAGIDALPVPIRDLWNPWKCPAAVLPWLAWAVSVDDWDVNWGEDAKRQIIADSVTVHRHKGTRGAVRRALTNLLGSEAFTLIEGATGGLHDASRTYNGDRFYGHDDGTFTYGVA